MRGDFFSEEDDTKKMPSTICFEIILTLADMNDREIPGNSAGDLFGMVK